MTMTIIPNTNPTVDTKPNTPSTEPAIYDLARSYEAQTLAIWEGLSDGGESTSTIRMGRVALKKMQDGILEDAGVLNFQLQEALHEMADQQTCHRLKAVDDIGYLLERCTCAMYELSKTPVF